MKSNQVDVLAPAVLRDFQQIDDAQKTRFARQLGSDVRKPDRRDRIHFDFAFIHRVPVAHLDVRPHPDADAARDFSAPHSLAQPFGEDHLRPSPAYPRPFWTARARAFAASSSRFFGAAVVSSELRSRSAIPLISSTAAAKGASLAFEGL